MKIQQIRNATLRISYAGQTFLVDPWLAPKGSMGTFRQIGLFFKVFSDAEADAPMPATELPMSVEETLKGVDAYVVTHVHPDHVDIAPDGTVGALLDKSVPAFVQSDDDKAVLERSGFTFVSVLSDESSFKGVRLVKTPGRHGVIHPCGPSCGVVFQNPDEKTLYLAGDTVWFSGVEETLARFKPDVIVLNSCAAHLVHEGRLIMDDEEACRVKNTCPDATVILSHMDVVAHATITRARMRQLMELRGVMGDFIMPEDGETLAL